MDTPIWYTFKNNDQWRAYLQKLIKTNNKALLKAIKIVYDNQTPEEKAWYSSCEYNGKGFNRWDSGEMSAIAEKIKKKEQLKPNEIIHSRFVMPKYWKQLMEESKRKMEVERLEKEYELCSSFYNLQQKYSEENEELKQCLEEGKSCEYGVCRECPISVLRTEVNK